MTCYSNLKAEVADVGCPETLEPFDKSTPHHNSDNRERCGITFPNFL